MTNKLDPLEVYQKYMAVKLHFTSKGYDFHKYGGKVKGVSLTHFNKRRDKHFFYRLAAKYRPNEIDNLLVSNLMEDPKMWVGTLFDEESVTTYKAYMKRKGAILEYFRDDLEALFDQVEDPIDALSVQDGQHPLILKEIITGRFNIQSLVMLARVLPINYFTALDTKLGEDIIWPDIKNRAEKIEPFMAYPKRKTKDMVKKILSEHI